MSVQKYETTGEFIQELHNEGHPVIYERITEYPVVKGIAQIPPALHLLTPDGKVVGIYVAPKKVWRRRESDDCIRDEPGIKDNPFKRTHDANAPKKIRRFKPGEN
nr:hypothetical protein [uncultured Kosakonia sp.]